VGSKVIKRGKSKHNSSPKSKKTTKSKKSVKLKQTNESKTISKGTLKDVHKKFQNEIPKGIRVLIYYSIILSLFYLSLLFQSDISVFFGFLISGMFAKTLNFIFFLLILVIVYGLIKRIKWTYYLTLSIYFLSLLSSFISILSWNEIQNSILSSLTIIIIPTIILSILINGLTFWYVLTKKEYFFSNKKIEIETKEDKIFTYSINLFLIITFIVIIGSLINFSIRITDTIDELMVKINNQTFTESLFFCDDQKEDKDLCYVALATKHSNEEYISRLCNKIESNFYQFTCYRAIE
jgi:hypothetical protein